MALRYKYECIKYINNAVSAEGRSVRDATIAAVLLMCTDEVCFDPDCSRSLFLWPEALRQNHWQFLCGNLDVSILHADAIVRMVTMRGGLKT